MTHLRTPGSVTSTIASDMKQLLVEDLELTELEKLLSDPQQFAISHGITLTPEELRDIKEAAVEIGTDVQSICAKNAFLTDDDRVSLAESISEHRTSASLVEVVAVALALVAAARKALKR